MILIPFDTKKYAALVKTVHLGNWIVNSSRAKGKKLKEYEEIEQYILSFAENTGFGRRVLKDKLEGRFYLSETLEDEAHQHSNRYNDDIFWDTLIELLAVRDLHENYSLDEIEALSEGEYEAVFSEAAARYEEEFDQYGIDRLSLDKS